MVRKLWLNRCFVKHARGCTVVRARGSPQGPRAALPHSHQAPHA